MTVRELDEYFRNLLDIQGVSKIDSSLNGLQIGEYDWEVGRAAFAVDACMETFRRAKDAGAGLLFVHHGLMWGRPERITGSAFRRVAFLASSEIALYAAHLPLDMHPELGNNAELAGRIGLQDIGPFGEYKGLLIGFQGTLPEASDIDGILRRLSLDRSSCDVLPFGSATVRSVGIVSGGAPMEVSQAIDAGLDLYLTGEAGHSIYHLCQEAGINVIAGGHYHTETWGVRALAERLKADTGMDTIFIDVPTGM